MYEEIKITFKDNEFIAPYSVEDDTLVVFLPDGSTRSTQLRGLKPSSAAKTHLKSWASQQQSPK